MSAFGDTDLTPAAAVRRLPGVAAAVFPHDPERAFYNNALLARGLVGAALRDAIEVMEETYADAGVPRFAAWAHESDEALRAELGRRGYTIDTTTRAMGVTLDEVRTAGPQIDVSTPAWSDYLRMWNLPEDLLRSADHSAFHLRAASVDGKLASIALAFDHAGDCGIYNVGTLEHARRLGLATALTALQLNEASERGCRTASIQSTEPAERVYASLGFRDLGRILEYTPG